MGSRPLTRKEFEEGKAELWEQFDEEDRRLWEAFDERLNDLDSVGGCKMIQKYADRHRISFVDAFDILAPTPPGVKRPVDRTKKGPSTEVRLDEQIKRRASQHGVSYGEATEEVFEQLAEEEAPTTTFAEEELEVAPVLLQEYEDDELMKRATELANGEGIEFAAALDRVVEGDQ